MAWTWRLSHCLLNPGLPLPASSQGRFQSQHKPPIPHQSPSITNIRSLGNVSPLDMLTHTELTHTVEYWGNGYSTKAIQPSVKKQRSPNRLKSPAGPPPGNTAVNTALSFQAFLLCIDVRACLLLNFFLTKIVTLFCNLSSELRLW